MSGSFHSCVIPLFRKNVDGVPELYGSATLLAFGGSGFLATAAHCFDEVAANGLFIGVRGEITNIVAKGHKGSGLYDVGYLRLSEDIFRELAERSHFLEAADIDTMDVDGPGSHYTFIGYPLDLTPPPSEDRRFRPKSVSYTDRSLDGRRKLEAAAEDPPVHIAINFDRKRCKHEDGSIAPPPDPTGMSGGGIFRYHPSAASDPPRLRLVGIGTHNDDDWLRGVRIAAILRLIRDHHPDIASHVPAPFLPNPR